MPDALQTFQAERGRMFGIAYRMLGSVTDAEDVLQDAWLRWEATNRSTIRDPGAFLATVVTRLCLTALTSARARREVYVGPWLPEPVQTDRDPALLAEHAESLNLAVLRLLERLTPAERAVYVLHEAFGYPFAQVAEVLEISQAGARQLASRARRHLAERDSVPVAPAERDRLLAAFQAAAESGDVAALESVLAADVISVSDGGGRVLAARKEVRGRARVAQFILGVLEKFTAGVSVVPTEVGGEPAFVGVRDGQVMALWCLDVGADGVRGLYIVLNPDKLAHVRVDRPVTFGPPLRSSVIETVPPDRKESPMPGTTSTVLVTGGSRGLGVPTVELLRQAGFDVRVLSRTAAPGRLAGDLDTGAGVPEALQGVHTVVHLATNRRKDIGQTRLLLKEAKRAGVQHLVFMSIVGVDRIPYGYYRDKVASEEAIASSGIPYTILRATQFHSFVGALLKLKTPVMLVPDVPVQPIATEEVAARLVELVQAGPSGRVADIGGPEVLSVRECADDWNRAHGRSKPVLTLRLPGKLIRAFKAGYHLTGLPGYGTGTFAQYAAVQARDTNEA